MLLIVTIPDGSLQAIENLASSEVGETLGVLSSLEGKGETSLKKMRKKADKWINSVVGSKLHRRMFWTSVERQF